MNLATNRFAGVGDRRWGDRHHWLQRVAGLVEELRLALANSQVAVGGARAISGDETVEQ
jgi:hypothetical protein